MMHKKIIFLAFLYFTVYQFLANAQDDALVIIRGETINQSLKAIAGVNIYIQNKGIGTMSNDEGNFEIKAKMSDTIVFSFVGYSKIILPAKMLYKEYQFIKFEEHIYELNKIDIMEFRWKEFNYDVMNLELKPFEQKILVLEGLPNPFMKFTPCKPSPVMNPATFLYELLKKENIRKRKQKRWTNIYERSYIKVN